MNRHIIIGNLTRDPEAGSTPNGMNYTSFTVAVNRRRARAGEPEADFVRVTTWGTLAENCKKYLRKGRKVAAVGESSAHGWTGQDGTPRAQIELTAVDVEFLGGSRSGEEGYAADGSAPAAPAPEASAVSTAGPAGGMTPVQDPEEQPW